MLAGVGADEPEREGCLMPNEKPRVGVSPGAALTPTCSSLRWLQASAELLLLPLGHPSSSRLPGAASGKQPGSTQTANKGWRPGRPPLPGARTRREQSRTRSRSPWGQPRKGRRGAGPGSRAPLLPWLRSHPGGRAPRESPHLAHTVSQSAGQRGPGRGAGKQLLSDPKREVEERGSDDAWSGVAL